MEVDIARKRKYQESTTVTIPRQKTHESVASSVEAAFNNHIIIDYIVPYLDHTSIKNLRTLSQNLNTIIRLNRNFRDRSRYTFHKSSLFKVYLNLWIPSMPLRNVSIHLDQWDMETEFELILDTVSNVASLEILPTRSSYSTQTETDMLRQLLRNCRKLKEIILDVDVFQGTQNTDFSHIVMDLQIQENLKGLNSLSINGTRRIALNSNFVSILTLLGTSPTALVNLKINRIMPALKHDNIIQILPILRFYETGFYEPILRKQAKSLTSLTWDYYNWGNNPIPSFSFESLQELELVSTDCNYLYLRPTTCATSLLQQLCPLITLKMDIQRVIPTSDVELSEALRKHFQTLKVFNLTWDQPWMPWTDLVPVSRGPPRPLPLRFSFLQNFTVMEEFKLYQVSNESRTELLRKRDPRAPMADILLHLPDGVRQIDLGGAVAVAKSQIPNRIRIIESLGKFHNLQSLVLVQCPAAIDDSILAFICSQMKQLTELGFSHCNELTDFGLTGKKKAFTVGHGLNSLTSLKKLRILSCSQLTRCGYINAISFDDLKELTLCSAAAEINCSFYEQLMSQNKRLEVLEISDRNTKIRELEVALKEQFASFRCLKFMEPLPEIMRSIVRY